ncbi:MAG: penicillin acylase family protein [Chitinophagales bacterium]|nr:penicillin acylase family protein [Chitinophagales bacterium]
MKKFLWIFFLYVIVFNAYSNSVKINTQNTQIIRDKYGVPHIYAPTDEEVAYGLAWATCEDDISSVQENLLTARGRLAEVKGKDGAIMDFIASFVGARETVDKLYDNSFSPKFKNILNAYVQGVNQYTKQHPEELWLKDVFPITEKDVLVGYAIGMALMTNVPFSVMKIADGNMWKFEQLKQVKGSNAFAVNSNKTKDGNTYLGINSHQPLEGPYSWYEAHLHSDEGWNILGGTFPGGVTIFHGATPNLAWAHTISFADLDDVYKLRMHPTKKLTYYYDGKWLKLKEKVCKMKVKIFGFIKIPVTKKFYESVYGPTLKKNDVFYALRFPARFDIRSAEQWYKMNKSTNLEEFKDALKMQSFAGLNIIYADKDNNIYYVDNGQFPKRNKNYDWWHVLPGDTSATMWKANDYYPFDSLFQIQNPICGWIHSNNQTPFFCTMKGQNIDRTTHPLKDFYFAFNNNRSLRTNYLLSNSGKLSYDEFKAIKYDGYFINMIA